MPARRAASGSRCSTSCWAGGSPGGGWSRARSSPGCGQQGVAALSTLWIPIVVENNATRYGAIGVSFALLSWLVLISIVLVAAAAVSVELGRRPAPPPPAAGSELKLFGTLARLLGADEVPAGRGVGCPRSESAGRPARHERSTHGGTAWLICSYSAFPRRRRPKR